jgi:L,D-transpeptidase ErfK/SrfK
VSPALAGIAGALLLVSLIGPSAAVAGPRLEMLPPLMGEPYSVTVQPGDTLLDIAFEHRVGFEQLARLNPGVDIWLPEPGTPIEVPTRVAPPGAPPEGLVVNIPEMRLYDFTVPGEPGVHAIAIGDPEAQTPTGDFRLGLKRIFPTWHVPESIRQERPELPPAVPPGPENPLGDHWMTLGTSSYGIHGTNNRWSIGRMSTHGCIRLYGDVMRDLYDRVPEGTRVQIVYQPVKLGRKADQIYLEAHPDVYGLRTDWVSPTLVRLLVLGLYDAVNPDHVRRLIEEPRGVPVRIGVVPLKRASEGAATSSRSY